MRKAGKALGRKSFGPVNSYIGTIYKNETEVIWRFSKNNTVQEGYLAVQGGYMTIGGGYMHGVGSRKRGCK